MLNRPLSRGHIGASLFACGVAVAATPAAAALTVGVSCDRSLICPSVIMSSDNPGNPYVAGTVVHTDGTSSAFPNVTGESAARSRQGALGVKASVAGGRTAPGFVDIFDGLGSGTGQGEVRSFASWSDSFLVSSDTLAAGTLVTVRFTHVIDIADLFAFVDNSATVYPNIVASTLTSAKLSFDFPGLSACLVGNAGTPAYACDSASSSLHIGRNVLTTDVQLRVGQAAGFEATLLGTALYYDAYSYSRGHGSAGFDALGTAHSYVSLMTPGTTITAGSGALYAAPAVPEPSSWAMLVGGFGIIGASLRRRRTAVSGNTTLSD